MGACTESGKMCIVCELLQDSVSGILRKMGENVSLFRRLKMARDTASGMAWLHGAVFSHLYILFLEKLHFYYSYFYDFLSLANLLKKLCSELKFILIKFCVVTYSRLHKLFIGI
jgi:hypothetical protein